METLLNSPAVSSHSQPRWTDAGKDPSLNQSSGQLAAWSPGPDLMEIAIIDFGLITELILLFLEDTNSRLTSLRNLCSAQDFERVRKQAHALKGSALQMGAKVLASRCASLELSATISHLECLLMIEAISNECLAVRKAMEAYLVDAAVPRC